MVIAMIIRQITADDINSVCEVDRGAFSKSWNEQAFLDELNKDYSYYFAAEEDDKIIGYAGIWCIYETAELVRIAVMPEFRGRGVGKMLMDTIAECAKEHGCERMMLEVRAGNGSARALYQRDGFKEISIRKGYYDGEDAVIMERIYE